MYITCKYISKENIYREYKDSVTNCCTSCPQVPVVPLSCCCAHHSQLTEALFLIHWDLLLPCSIERDCPSIIQCFTPTEIAGILLKENCHAFRGYIFLLVFQEFCFTLKVGSVVRGGLVGPNKSRISWILIKITKALGWAPIWMFIPNFCPNRSTDSRVIMGT
jgi:hypothetical protein